MEATLHALGEILVQAIPTFFLVLLLFLYLRSMFFKPLERVLAERSEATEGARKKASEALDHAQAKAAAYEEKIREARNDLYREQEEVRRKWREDQIAQVAAARQSADAAVKEAKAQITADANQAKATLAGNSQSLADQITNAILQRRPV
jgi:F-type H+-transporting ATPase subunit b